MAIDISWGSLRGGMSFATQHEKLKKYINKKTLVVDPKNEFKSDNNKNDNRK